MSRAFRVKRRSSKDGNLRGESSLGFLKKNRGPLVLRGWKAGTFVLKEEPSQLYILGVVPPRRLNCFAYDI
jgi:hypothetical protein